MTTSLATGKLVLVLRWIILILVVFFIMLYVVSNVSGQISDSMCKMNAAMNSVTPGKFWLMVPNFACYPKSVIVDSQGRSSILKSTFGKVKRCNCKDFYGTKLNYNPDRIIDGDLSTWSAVPSRNNVTRIKFYVENKTSLGNLEVYFKQNSNFNYTLSTKESKYFWTSYEKCAEGEHTGKVLDVDVDCSIDETKSSGAMLELIRARPIPLRVNETNLSDSLDNEIYLRKILYPIGESNILQEECEVDRINNNEDHCSPEWEKKWVEKKIAELIMRCWKMGGRGNIKGDFGCFSGCVYYNSSALPGDERRITKKSIVTSLRENYVYDAISDTAERFNETVSKDDILIESSDHLDDGRCYYMKYYNGVERNLPFTDVDIPYLSQKRGTKVIVSFGRTTIDASEGL